MGGTRRSRLEHTDLHETGGWRLSYEELVHGPRIGLQEARMVYGFDMKGLGFRVLGLGLCVLGFGLQGSVPLRQKDAVSLETLYFASQASTENIFLPRSRKSAALSPLSPGIAADPKTLKP